MSQDSKQPKPDECERQVTPGTCPLAQNGWHEYRRMVVNGMKDQQEALSTLRQEHEDQSLATVKGMAALELKMSKQFSSLDKAIATLKARAGAWGAAAGLIVSILGLVITLFFKT